MSTRSRVIGFGSAGLLVVAGVVGGVVFGGTFGQVLALVLISLGLVLATGLVFYEVGLSEDRERARETAEKPPPADHRSSRAPRLRHPRLGRARGHRRRLK